MNEMRIGTDVLDMARFSLADFLKKRRADVQRRDRCALEVEIRRST
jgi:hypothetical protein